MKIKALKTIVTEKKIILPGDECQFEDMEAHKLIAQDWAVEIVERKLKKSNLPAQNES